MAIQPNSTIFLCSVPFDGSYKNQVHFTTLASQTSYFTNKVVKTFGDYSYIKKDKDGKQYSGVRVGHHIDTLELCNYIMYRNNNYTNKRFFAFIVEMIYINDNCTEIYFDTDVYQTWLFDVNLLSSFVVREHTSTDVIGQHIVPEDFNFKDFHYYNMTHRFIPNNLTEYGYLVGTTEKLGAVGSRGKLMSGIYQGLYFYYFENSNYMNDFLDEIERQGGDCVQFITTIPRFNMDNEFPPHDDGWVYYSTSPASLEVNDVKFYLSTFDDYKPKNNKLWTSQFYSLMVSNNGGETNDYALENWSGGSEGNVSFSLFGDVSASPSVFLVPRNYNNILINYDESVQLSSFPQCSFNSDSFKLWLSRNQFGVMASSAGGVAQVAGGVASGNPFMIAGGASSIGGTISSIYSHSKEPNKPHAGNVKSNLLTACNQNKFSIYLKYLRGDFARIVDDYLTMFGYKTNLVKAPNTNTRPCWNYIQTIDVNLQGSIPFKDMEKLKNVYNNGITLWRSNARFCDYSQDNSIARKESE